MILKGNQRGDGSDLARHLSNAYDNEHVEIAEVRGAVADDLDGAFAEFEAVSLGTKAKEYLYSLSINPPRPLTREQYSEAIAVTEKRLGLTGQPRAVVFHVKEGREHCHVVWSRINAERMRAIHMAHDHSRLMDLGCELARKFGFELTAGQKAWEAKQKFEKDKLEPTLAENAQQAETGIAPEQRRAEITAAYEASDSAEAFRAALEQKGYIIAKGDRRAAVVVDAYGHIHSLTRYIKGHKPKAIRSKLAGMALDQLPSVDQAKETARQRMQAQKDREREQKQSKDQAAEVLSEARRKREEARKAREAALAAKQAARRLEVQQAEQELLTRQQDERLSLHIAQLAESKGFLFQVRSTVADLIARTPGLRSVLSHIQKLTHLDPRERHRMQDEALSRRHHREKADIERRKRALSQVEKREQRSLEKAIRRDQRLDEAARLEAEHTMEQSRSVENMAMQDFHEAARDQGLWKGKEFEEGELSQSFNDAAGIDDGPPHSGDDDGNEPDPDIDPTDDGDDVGPKQRRRRRRGRGFGYRRDE